MWHEVAHMPRPWNREPVRRRQGSPGGPPPNWSARTQVLSTKGCPVGAGKARQVSRWAIRIRAWGRSGLRNPQPGRLGRRACHARVLKRGLEFPSEAIITIGSHSLVSLHDRLRGTTSLAGAKDEGNGNHNASSSKRLAQSEPSGDRAGTWPGTRAMTWRHHARQRIVLSTIDADRRRGAWPRERVRLA